MPIAHYSVCSIITSGMQCGKLLRAAILDLSGLVVKLATNSVRVSHRQLKSSAALVVYCLLRLTHSGPLVACVMCHGCALEPSCEPVSVVTATQDDKR